MKKLFIISVLFVNLLCCYSQRIYTPEEYRKQALENNIVSIIFSPHKLGFGLGYISKPWIKESQYPFSFSANFDIGFYRKEDNSWLKLIKLNPGACIVIKNFNFNLSPSFNLVKNDTEKEFANPITFELGAMTKINKVYVSCFIDPILLEAKFGIGLGF